MKYFKKLIGEKIYLSPLNEEDVEKLAEWQNDFEVTDYVGRTENIVTISNEKEWLKEISNKQCVMGIIVRDTDEIIGVIELSEFNNASRNAVLGIQIGEKKARGQGHGEDAINLILDYAFNYLNLRKVSLTVLECNKRAIACYEKCGFMVTGKKREEKYINGIYYDIILMDILKEEYMLDHIQNKEVGK